MSSNRLSDRGFTASRGLSYTFTGTATQFDAALPLSHGLGALPGALELWVEVSAGQWEQHDPATYVTASTTALTTTGTTLPSVVGGATNVRLVAAAGAVAVSVEEASLTKAGIVSTGTQNFAGVKTFAVDPTFTSGSQLVTTGTQTIAGAKTFSSATILQDTVNAGWTPLTVESTSTSNIYFSGLTNVANNRIFITHNYYRDNSATFQADSLSVGVSGIGFDDGVVSFLTAAAGSTSASERMRISSAGNVGIGTSNFTGVATNADNLLIGGSGETGITLRSTTASSIRFNDTADAGILEYNHSSNYMRMIVNGATEAMRIDSTGAVTLGPAATFNYDGQRHYVSGALWADNVSSSASSGFFVIGTNAKATNASTSGQGRTDTTTGGAALLLDNKTSSTQTAFEFRTNLPGDATSVQASVVGQCTHAGAWTLGPNTSSNIQHRLQGGNNASNGADYAVAIENVNGTSSDFGFIRFLKADGTQIGAIRGNGVANTTTYATSSDVRLKTNIAGFQGLELVNAIQAAQYERISDPGTIEYGVLAQQLHTVIPQAVLVGGENPIENPWCVDYSRLTPVLVKAIQELHAELQAAKNRITQLEGAN